MSFGLKETKVYLEKMFSLDWTLTPIHYAGEEFDSNDVEKWINIMYSPMLASSFGVCQTKNVTGNLHVVCWADYDIDAMELSDNVVEFVNQNIDKTKYIIKRFEIGDHGWNNSNKVFVLLTFSIEMLVA